MLNSINSRFFWRIHVSFCVLFTMASFYSLIIIFVFLTIVKGMTTNYYTLLYWDPKTGIELDFGYQRTPLELDDSILCFQNDESKCVNFTLGIDGKIYQKISNPSEATKFDNSGLKWIVTFSDEFYNLYTDGGVLIKLIFVNDDKSLTVEKPTKIPPKPPPKIYVHPDECE